MALCATESLSSVEGERTANKDACVQDGRCGCNANPAAVVATVIGLVAVSPIIGASVERGTAPFEGVAQDAQRLALRGRLSPTESATLR